MAKLAAVRPEVEATAAADAARVAVVELEALRVSSTGSSISTDDDRDNELKLMRQAVQEQAVQWPVAHPQGCCGGSPDGRGRADDALGGGPHDGRAPTAAVAQASADALAVRLTEITAFTGDAALPPRTGIMVTMGSTPLSGTSVPTAGGLPSPRPTTSSGPR
jgi:hypothetical protein